jgi:APA family basic amino acid/polyamine antiporter
VKEERQLGIWSCAALVVGNMIGSGIFLLPASLAAFGTVSLLGWGFTAAGSIFVALVFARLASIVPKAGGPYAYTREAFGDFAGFWIAWGYWVALWSGNGAIAIAFASYLSVFFPWIAQNRWSTGVIAAAAVWTLTAVNCSGIRRAGELQVVTTILKLAPLVLLATVGLFFIDSDNLTPFNASGKPLFSAVSAVAALTLWSFLGLESATVPAGNVKDPEKTIPRATVVGTIVTAVVYVLSTVTVMGALPRESLATSGAPFADAARAMWGDWAYYLVGFGAVISCFGALNGWMLLAGQVPMAAARDGLFPRAFARLNNRGVPAFAMIFAAILISILLIFNYSGTSGLVEIFSFIILLATLSSLVPYAFCSLAPLLLQRSRRGWLLCAIAFAYSVWAAWGSGAETVLYGFILFLLGIPAYVLLRREGAMKEEGR